jgi:hypothetical protein
MRYGLDKNFCQSAHGDFFCMEVKNAKGYATKNSHGGQRFHAAGAGPKNGNKRGSDLLDQSGEVAADPQATGQNSEGAKMRTRRFVSGTMKWKGPCSGREQGPNGERGKPDVVTYAIGFSFN